MKWIKLILLLLVIDSGCIENDLVTQNIILEENITIQPAKWYKKRDSAVSLTYDALYSDDARIQAVINATLEHDLKLDFEFVSSQFQSDNYSKYLSIIKNELIPKGIHFFGHGHEHINHDNLSFEDALISFKNCYESMENSQLNPTGYAYPGGKGHKYTTQLANKEAGFKFARGTNVFSNDCFINANSNEVENWYLLPSVVAGQGNDSWISNNSEMTEVFHINSHFKSWVIICYHSIGIEGGYAYYPMDDFKKDLQFLEQNNTWCDNMDRIYSYITERDNFKYSFNRIDDSEQYTIIFSDGLNDSLYNVPLTLEFEFEWSINPKGFILETDGEKIREHYFIDSNQTFEFVPDDKLYQISFIY